MVISTLNKMERAIDRKEKIKVKIELGVLQQAGYSVSIDNQETPVNNSEQAEGSTEITDYEVEKIEDYKVEKGYFVKWKNWDASTNTWEPERHLYDCHLALADFYLIRRKEHYEEKIRRKALNLRGHTALPAIPPDPRPIDVQIEDYFALYPQISSRELNKCLVKYGLNIPERTANSAKFSKMISNAIFKFSGSNELKLLRETVTMHVVKIRRKAVHDELQAWSSSMNEVTNSCPIISVENNVDLETKPEHFQYVNLSSFSKVLTHQEDSSGCRCDGDCLQSKKSCCGVYYGSESVYSRSYRMNAPPGTPIYECNDQCTCGHLCHNRVVQDGVKCLQNMEYCIFRTSTGCGWGLKTLKYIPRGKFVCMLVGEIISSQDAAYRQTLPDKNIGKYLFNLNTVHNTSPYVVDFSSRGNVSHFINHSCSPNLAVYPLYVNCRDINLPKLALFSTVAIPANTELTYSYFDVDQARRDLKTHRKTHGRLSPNTQRCLCQSHNCVEYSCFPN